MTNQTEKKTKFSFIKMLLLCFPAFKKKPSPEQNEIIEIINEGIDHLQDIVREEFLVEKSDEVVENKKEEKVEENDEKNL